MDSKGESSTILFVDDDEILYRAGTRRTAAQAKRFSGNPVIRGAATPWEGWLGWCSVHHDTSTGEYRLWYQSYKKKPSSDPLSSVVCVATSKDGNNWRRPNLHHHLFEEAPTNIVIAGNRGYSHRYSCSVIEDPLRTFDDRFIMAYYDFGRIDGNEYPGLFLAHSEDGLDWRIVDGGPFVKTAYGIRGFEVPLKGTAGTSDFIWDYPLTMSDAIDLYFDEISLKYVWYGKVWLDGPDGKMAWKHGLGFTSSKDLINWDSPRVVLWPDDDDPAHVEFHTGSVFVRHGIYFCLLQILNRGERAGVIDVELAVSRDGISWQRPFRNARLINRNEIEEFDGGSILTNSTPVFLPEETRFYYGGYSMGATGTLGVKKGIKTGVGYASIENDRFASVQNVSGPGQITLKPRFLPSQGRISLNADASKGFIQLELLDENGYRIPGFEREFCKAICENSLATDVRWKTASRYPEHKVMIRIYLNDASIYALYLHE
jgi:hypothetical protein